MAVGVRNYPTSLDTATELYRVGNQVKAALTSAAASGASTLNLDDATNFPAQGTDIVIETSGVAHIRRYTGKTGNQLTGVTAITGAAAHNSGDKVEIRPIAAHHDILRDSIIALQEKLGFRASTPASGNFFRGVAAGESAWGTADLDALSDVAITSPASRQALSYFGGQWVNRYADVTLLTTASGTSVSGFVADNIFTSDFDTYILEIVWNGGTANTGVRLRFRDSTPASITTANYGYAQYWFGTSGAGVGAISQAFMQLMNPLGASVTFATSHLWLHCVRPAIASDVTHINGTMQIRGSTGAGYTGFTGGSYNVAQAVQGVEFIPAAGTINGTMRVYGVPL